MTPERVVVRAPNWLGDVVLSLAAVRDVRRNLPGARIEVLAKPSVAAVYEAVPEVDGILRSVGVRADAAALRGRFDAAVLLPNSFGTAAAAWLARVPERWGYRTDGRGLLLTRRPAVPRLVRGQSQVYYYRAMLAGIGLDVSSVPDVTLVCPPDWSGAGAARLPPDRTWIGLNPGAAFGTAKRWVPERFAAAATLLARERGASVAILGGPAERGLGAAIASQVDAPVRNLCGETTLPELCGVIARLSLLLTNDSGPMHLAAALGTPVVAIFGPTDPAETAPVTSRARLVREPVPCSPCLLRECPIDHRCMRRVSVGQVVEAARDLSAAP